MNNLCCLIKLLSLFQAYVFIPSCVALSICFLLLNFCRIIRLLPLSHPLLSPLFMLSTHPITVPALHTKQHNSYPRLIVHTLFVPIHFSNSTCVFSHRAIVMWGDQGLADCFQLEQPDSFNDKVLKQMTVNTFILTNRLFFISLISLQILYILLLQLILKYPIYLM